MLLVVSDSSTISQGISLYSVEVNAAIVDDGSSTAIEEVHENGSQQHSFSIQRVLTEER